MSASQGDLYAVRVFYQETGGIAENSFGFKARQAVAGDAQLDLANSFATSVVKNTSGGLLFHAAATLSCSKIQVEDIKPGTLATYEQTFAAVVGSDAGQALPNQCAIVFTLRTGTKGRSYRGRFYLPGPTENTSNAGNVDPTYQTYMDSIGVNLMGLYGPSGSNANWELVVISRFLNKVKRATPVGTAVTSITAEPIVHTQRRRVLGVGS